tara:strand:+ start:1049 stop:1324 length:276 start_codon:yes stop_codon:yes gene_type:complete
MSSLSELMPLLMPSQEERAIFNLQEKEYTISRRPPKRGTSAPSKSEDPYGKSSGISQGESGIIGSGTKSSASQVRESQEDLRPHGSEPTHK